MHYDAVKISQEVSEAGGLVHSGTEWDVTVQLDLQTKSIKRRRGGIRTSADQAW
jgi:hypothetical protein